jgi:hypothetical protein
MEFGLNQAASVPILPTYDPTTWIGATMPTNLMAPYVPEGSLMLTLVDRVSNKVVWTGTVTEKLDNENKQKSLSESTRRLLSCSQFPPKKQ